MAHFKACEMIVAGARVPPPIPQGKSTVMNLRVTYVQAGLFPLFIYSLASETDMLWVEQTAVRRLRSGWPYVHRF